MVCGTAHVPWPFRLPWMLSTRLVIVTGSVATLLFVTTTVNSTFSPGANTCFSLAVFVTEMAGSTFVTVTVFVRGGGLLPSLSWTVALAVFG